MKTRFFLALSLLLMSQDIQAQESTSPKFKIGVLGLGSRSHSVLFDCFRFNRNIQVVAACDDHAQDTLDFFVQRLESVNMWAANAYKNIFEGVSVYPDTEDGLEALLKNHSDLDVIFITSPNYRHLPHLQAVQGLGSCKKIYMEKPLFTSFDELTNFKLETDTEVLIGLTLRYASMSTIVVKRLQEFQDRLGELKRVKGWEYLRFCHGLGAFMMSWRRHTSLSGGLLLEKCVHDLDLAFFFMDAIGIKPDEIKLRTETAHKLYRSSNIDTIKNEIKHNGRLDWSLRGLHGWGFERYVPFTFNRVGGIDWPTILDGISTALPIDDDFKKADIIPDSHHLSTTLKTADGRSVDFDFDVDFGAFRLGTQRCIQMFFEHGQVEIDVMGSNMKISLDGGSVRDFDLLTNNSDHADGDQFIARAILGIPIKEQYVATFNDPIVQLANILALASEKQAVSTDAGEWVMKKLDGAWKLVS